METAIDLEPDGTIEVGKSQFLFEGSPYERFRGSTDYDANSDGRFLMVKGSAPSRSTSSSTGLKNSSDLHPRARSDPYSGGPASSG